jgi:hypothetical protein
LKLHAIATVAAFALIVQIALGGIEKSWLEQTREPFKKMTIPVGEQV